MNSFWTVALVFIGGGFLLAGEMGMMPLIIGGFVLYFLLKYHNASTGSGASTMPSYQGFKRDHTQQQRRRR